MKEENTPWIVLGGDEISGEELATRIEANLTARRQALGAVTITVPTFQTVDHLSEKPDNLPHSFTLFKHLETLATGDQLKPFGIVLASSPLDHIPLVGRLWKAIKRAAHRLVLFYVNNLIRYQARINRELIYLANELVQENTTLKRRISALEKSTASGDPERNRPTGREDKAG